MLPASVWLPFLSVIVLVMNPVNQMGDVQKTKLAAIEAEWVNATCACCLYSVRHS
ncbi:hypothetical protein ACLB1R_15325 [Escherichia coli]